MAAAGKVFLADAVERLLRAGKTRQEIYVALAGSGKTRRQISCLVDYVLNVRIPRRDAGVFRGPGSSLSDRIEALLRAGVDNAGIHAALASRGAKHRTIVELISRVRRTRLGIRVRALTPPRLTPKPSPAALSYFAAAAPAYGLTPVALMELLIETVAQDQLLPALDLEGPKQLGAAR